MTPRPSPIPVTIRIERVGGGASPEGFAAFVYPDETVARPLREITEHGVEDVQDWTEEACHARAISALMSFENDISLPLWRLKGSLEFPLSHFPFLNGVDRLRVLHEISDMISRVDYALIP
jgi:hypothetical protein